MKKRTLLNFLCCLCICLLMISFPCYAETELNDSMVYVTGEKLNQIYELLQDNSFDFKTVMEVDSLAIVKESITPVYTVDLLDYARSGEMKIIPKYYYSADIKAEENVNLYVAKTITSDGNFGGNVFFYIKDGKAHYWIYSPSEYSLSWEADGLSDYYVASSSYADHAARISKYLKKDDFVSPNDVKYVCIGPFAGQSFFYVNDGTNEGFYSVGYIPTTKSNKSIDNDMCVLSSKELLDIAEKHLADYNTELEEKANWEAMHPGEIWPTHYGESSSILLIMPEYNDVNNILDIASYLNIDYGTATKQELNIKKGNSLFKWTGLILIGIAVVLILSATVVVVLVKKNRKKSMQ